MFDVQVTTKGYPQTSCKSDLSIKNAPWKTTVHDDVDTWFLVTVVCERHLRQTSSCPRDDLLVTGSRDRRRMSASLSIRQICWSRHLSPRATDGGVNSANRPGRSARHDAPTTGPCNCRLLTRPTLRKIRGSLPSSSGTSAGARR
jgi:hypothetical protein